jgi:molecular chaperone GrpE
MEKKMPGRKKHEHDEQEMIPEAGEETAGPPPDVGGDEQQVEGVAEMSKSESLLAELEQAQAKANEYLEGWQRALADFSNYKRRVERDQAQTYQNAVGSVVKRYLVILDDMERALNNRPWDGDGAIWAEGIELIYRKLVLALDADGVTEMEAQGKQFDPNFHEAITQEASEDHESGAIIEVVQKGYMIGDRVLRPAMVRVAQ